MDLKAINARTKVQLPTGYPACSAMLQAFSIMLVAMLGECHPQSTNLISFVTEYMAKETFYIGRLSQEDGIYGPARLLRFIQLHAHAWFHEVEVAAMAGARAAITTPNYRQALYKMHVGDMSWLPELPPRHLTQPTTPSTAPPVAGMKDEGGTSSPWTSSMRSRIS